MNFYFPQLNSVMWHLPLNEGKEGEVCWFDIPSDHLKSFHWSISSTCFKPLQCDRFLLEHVPALTHSLLTLILTPPPKVSDLPKHGGLWTVGGTNPLRHQENMPTLQRKVLSLTWTLSLVLQELKPQSYTRNQPEVKMWTPHTQTTQQCCGYSTTLLLHFPSDQPPTQLDYLSHL